MKSFKDAMSDIPDSLRTLFTIRLTLGLVALVGAIVVWIAFELYVSCPIFALAGFFLVSGFGLCYNALTGNYVEVVGKCTNIELTSVRGAVKWIYVTSGEDNRVLRLPPKESSKKLNIGDDVTIYIPTKSIVCEYEGVFCVDEYYAIDNMKNI